ncbi:hypothetical protein N2W54_006790 [Lotmaria passim]
MGWWWSSSSQGSLSSTTDEAVVQNTQSVIASIFEPGNRGLTSAAAPTINTRAEHGKDLASTSTAAPSTTNITLHSDASYVWPPLHESTARDGWHGWTKQLGAWLPLSSSTSSSAASDDDSGSQKNAGTAALYDFPAATATTTATNDPAASASPSWDQLPPSPLAGYELTKHGLVDKFRTPPHTLSPAELKDLIRELTTVEQKAKYDVDKQFAAHLGNRGLHGLELLVNPCLFLIGIYLMTWKTVQLYNTALPQDSVVFTKLLALLQRRTPAGKRELLAQRHRRLMRATNARVAFSFLTGVGVFSLAWVSRPSKNVMEEAPDMLVAKEMVAYQRHAEASLKWCWYVYYHHPAYCSAGCV